MSQSFRFRVASVHGRFQPPHLEHLEYIVAALSLAEHVIVGITQPEIVALTACPEDPHRADQSANPFTYDERCEMISEMLVSDGFARDRFSFARFPIEQPDLVTAALPISVPCITTIRDKWNLVKIERLRSLGYDVHVLWDRSDVFGIQGTRVRELIQLDDPTWKKFLHPTVTDFMVARDLVSRLQKAK
jgi:cytidyltransferase-like protein